MFRHMILPTLIVGLSLVFCLPAEAQPPQKPGVEKPKKSPKIKVRRDKNGRLVYVFQKGWVVPGTIHRPNAQYFISRSLIDYKAKPLREIFVKRVLETVRRAPF